MNFTTKNLPKILKKILELFKNFTSILKKEINTEKYKKKSFES